MRFCEWIAVGYFLYLIVPIRLCAFQEVRKVLTWQVLGVAAALLVVAWLPPTGAWSVVRDWAPGVYLLAGYWLSGRLFTFPNERLERWLMAKDREWLGEASAGSAVERPPFLVNYFELSYLLCYPLVPLVFGLLYFQTRNDAAVAALANDTFWSAVLLAVFACYGLLPWLPTRPPRALLARGAAPATGVRKLNVEVLNRASIQVNTLPSGHVAAASAAALAVGQFLPAAGMVVGLIAVSIAIAAVVGRYHYVVDSVTGALTALVAFAVSNQLVQ